MQLVQDMDPQGYTIVGHADGEVHINTLRVTRSCIVAPDRLLTEWAPRTVDELVAEHLEPLFELAPELVLLGVGAQLRFPERGLLGPLLERDIGVEVMDTAAACRTYNLLKGDGRKVVAALLIG